MLAEIWFQNFLSNGHLKLNLKCYFFCLKTELFNIEFQKAMQYLIPYKKRNLENSSSH
jgi:hypothetical protein